MSETPAPDASPAADEGRAARAGFVLITGAKAWFLVCGTLLNIGLPRLFGDPTRFGDFGLVNTLIAVVNAVMIAGVLQAVAKRVSERPAAAGAVRRDALKLQLVIGTLVFLLLVGPAELICELVFGDPSLATWLRIAAVITYAYAFYAALIGFINGLKRFALQAAFDVAFATMKLVFMVGLVLAGFGVGGAITGFALAAVVIAIAAWAKTRHMVPIVAGQLEPAPLLGFMLQVMGYVLFINLLLQADLFLVKLAALGPVQAALDAGRTAWMSGLVDPATLPADADLAREATSAMAGLFKATKNVSLIPYQAVIAITFVIFPLVSRSTFESDRAATRTYVFQAIRSATLLVGVLATVLASGGGPLLALLFGDAYAIAAPTLLPLLGATAAFALFYVLASILTAAGHPRDALLLAASAALVELGALYIALPGAEPGAPLLHRAALIVLASHLTVLAAAGWATARRLRAPLPIWTLARTALAGGVALALAWSLPGQGLPAIFVRALVAGVSFVATAWLTREITGRDLALVKATWTRRGAK